MYSLKYSYTCSHRLVYIVLLQIILLMHFFFIEGDLLPAHSLPAYLTCAAMQWDAVAISELVSWAALEAAICFSADDAVCRTHVTPSPFWAFKLEQPLWADIQALTLKEVPGHAKHIWGRAKTSKVLGKEIWRRRIAENSFEDILRHRVIHRLGQSSFTAGV